MQCEEYVIIQSISNINALYCYFSTGPSEYQDSLLP